MSNESISNKVGNATGGTVGEETIVHQATHLASSTLEYGKGVLGLGGNKAAASADDAAHNTQGGQTLGGLVNEGRDLAANILGQAQTVIAGAEKKTNEAAGDAKASHEQGKPVGYVAQARELAANAVGVAQSYVQAGAAKVDEAASSSTAQDAKATASGLADDASKKADSVGDSINKNTSQSAVDDAKKSAGSATDTAFAKADEVKKGALDAIEKN